MKFSQGHRAVAGLVLILIAVVIAMVSWSGGRDDIAKEMKHEPQITVYFNDTGKSEAWAWSNTCREWWRRDVPDWPVEAYGAQAILPAALRWH